MGLNLLAFTLLGYLLGSLPMGVLVARWLRGVDLRRGGSGHIGALNTLRQAGKGAAALTLLLDLGKGLLATWLAARYGWTAFAPAAAGTAVIVGHCWPVWLRFRGGMGLATGAGAVVLFAPLIPLLGITAWWLILRVNHHSARAMAASMALMPLAAVLLGYSLPTLVLVFGGSLVIFLRHLGDFRRRYPAGWRG